MESPLLLLTLLALCIASVSGHVDSRAEAYWKAKFGNTPMPKFMIDSLKGLKEHTVKENPATISVAHTLGVYIRYLKGNEEAIVRGQKQDGKGYEEAIIKGQTQHAKGNEEATIDHELLNSGLDLFFFEQNLTHPRGKLNLHFFSVHKSMFFPSHLANSIPFSKNKLPEILKLLAITPNSTEAEIVEQTVTSCEEAPIKGEQNKHCSTSLEDLVDYVVSSIGSKVKVLSTTIDKETTMEYTVEKARKVSSEGNFVCHNTRYPYAVFYCHNIKNTDVYIVSLADTNGKKSKGVAVCHRDTSSWNPRHLAFQLLKVEPGSVPICHFLNADDMIWTAN